MQLYINSAGTIKILTFGLILATLIIALIIAFYHALIVLNDWFEMTGVFTSLKAGETIISISLLFQLIT